MSVLQQAKRSVLTAAVVCAVLTGCGESSPEVPFNPGGTSSDLQAVDASFGSSTFASFSSMSPLFDAALGGAPLISSSAVAMDVRSSGSGMRAAAVRSAERLMRILPKPSEGRAIALAISSNLMGKTFVYSGGAYVLSDRPGAPAQGVRFIIYAVDPVTQIPVEPLVETGYVDVTSVSSGTTNSARVKVVSGGVEYLNYSVTVSNTVSGGRVTVVGFVTDGVNQANITLRATVTFSAGLTLTYSVDVPSRDFSIDLTLSSSGLDPQTGSINVNLDVRGPNGWIQMVGQFDQNGGTLNVSVSGNHFATITQSGSTQPIITGSNGQPLTDDDIAALGGIFLITTDAFASFDQLFAPVGRFLEPAA